MFVDGGSGKPERDIYSLDSLISWLETKPSKGFYDYANCSTCMLSQYFREMGLHEVSLGTQYMYHSVRNDKGSWDQKQVELPAFFNRIASGPRYQAGSGGRFNRDWTFGEALNRAYRVTGHSISEPERGVLRRLAAVFGL